MGRAVWRGLRSIKPVKMPQWPSSANLSRIGEQGVNGLLERAGRF